MFLAASLLLPLFTPTATVTILPIERSITTTTAIQVHGRQVAPLTLAQSATVPATGTRHQAATRASGTITFYNGLLTSQTIAAGTVLTSSGDVHIVTDQPTTIPAANPPIEGQVTVSAHALNIGASGNISAYDIDQACCATSVLAKNTEAFTGGAAARDVIIVTKHDLEAATGATNTILLKSEQAALHAQVSAGEALIPPSCRPSTAADHRPGEEAKQVTVTVSETCTSIAYAAHDVDQDATNLITSQATTKLGANYSLIGDIQVHIIRATVTNQARGIATLAATLDATYICRLSPGEKRYLVKLIAGKTPQQAHALLSQAQGIAAAVITFNGNTATLPDDPGKITIVIAERG